MATNITAQTESNSSGIYAFPALSPGTYELTFEKEGFRTRPCLGNPPQHRAHRYNQRGDGRGCGLRISLRSGICRATRDTDVRSQLYGRNQARGRTPFAGPQSSSTGISVARSNPDFRTGRQRSGAIGSATNARISGGLAMQNAVLMDGGESRGFTSGGQAYSVPLESVAEFKVETSSYSSEFGHAAGGVVNVATKSGTNQYHGVLYEFLRNDHLNANSWSNNRNKVASRTFHPQ